VDLCLDNSDLFIGGGDKAADGNCLNHWYTKGFSPGPHRVCARLMFGMEPPRWARGPTMTITLPPPTNTSAPHTL
jgi:hypothetical protein